MEQRVDGDETWVCPFCGASASPSDETSRTVSIDFDMDNVRGPHLFEARVIVCPNKQCREFVLETALIPDAGAVTVKPGRKAAWRLVPPLDVPLSEGPKPAAMTLPDYVPEDIRQNYREACAVRRSSPAAAAALARRALREMIRDFWGIDDSTLTAQLAALEDELEPPVWEAIARARDRGNILRQMDVPAGVLVDADPRDAEELIRLVEMLVSEFYVKHRERKDQIEEIVDLAEAKMQARLRERGPAEGPNASS